MVEITAAMVKELRERTNVGMMECKKALVESNGNMEDAIKYLREKGISKAAAKATRETKEGLVFAYIHSNHKLGVLVEVNCESDFVARTDAFKTLCKDIAMQVAASNPIAIEPADIDPKIIEAEKEIARNKALNEGKPANIVDKIVEGSIQKFCKENSLLDQEFIKDPQRTIRSLVHDAVLSMGENIKVARFVRYSLGE
ncbi:MAG TPA: translation elongation factor Ts [Candidatus Cloacimonadota bacterium]|nr:translation elongation factor Ts [Candidatus Cloacimonadota bacterium]HPT71213.1 translation elongation factor Ts [Candidatus Cloacimonadota bacterium]